MAAAFCLGAEGVQMGTRMVSAAERARLHQNWKDMIVGGPGDRHRLPQPLRSRPRRSGRWRTEKTTQFEKEPPENIMSEFGHALDLYFGGDMEASIALSGQVAGRIDEVKPVAEILRETIDEFEAVDERNSAPGTAKAAETRLTAISVRSAAPRPPQISPATASSAALGSAPSRWISDHTAKEQQRPSARTHRPLRRRAATCSALLTRRTAANPAIRSPISRGARRDPGLDRNGEPLLPRPRLGGGGRRVPATCAAATCRSAPRTLNRSARGKAKRAHLGIEERRAALQPVRHQATVELQQQVVRQPGRHVGPLRLLQSGQPLRRAWSRRASGRAWPHPPPAAPPAGRPARSAAGARAG